MTVLTEWAQPNTDHGLLVAFGEFFQQHGLLQYLLRVPIRQKTRDLTPPAKLEVAVLGRAAVAPQRVTFEGPNGRLAGLVANSVHWCMPCLRTCVAEPTPTTNRTLSSPKHMVRVAANSPALVQQSVKGTALQFSPASALPGVTLFLRGYPRLSTAVELPGTVQNRKSNNESALVAQNLRYSSDKDFYASWRHASLPQRTSGSTRPNSRRGRGGVTCLPRSLRICQGARCLRHRHSVNDQCGLWAAARGRRDN